MNTTVALDSHAEATEHRPISPIEHDRVAAAAAAHDALAIGEPLLIVAGGPAAARAELCRALTTDRRAVGEDVLVLATRTDGAFPDSSLDAYLGLPAGAPDDARAEALAQYATAETRLVVMLTQAERLDDGGVDAIRRLRQSDPAARSLSVVLLGDDTVGLVGDRLLRPAPPGGLRFIRLTPLALAPAAPVAALPVGTSIAPPVIAPTLTSDPVIAPPAPPPVEDWPAAERTEAPAETPVPPPDHAASWDAAPHPAALDSGPDEPVGSNTHGAYDHGVQDHGAHDQPAQDHGAYHEPAYHPPAYDEAADEAADLALRDEPAESYDEPEAERTVPYWEALPERVTKPEPDRHPAPEMVEQRFDTLAAPREWHSYQDTPDPAPETVQAGAPPATDYAPQVVAAAPPPAPASKAKDKDWGTLKAAAQTGRYPPAAEGEAGAYAPADAASYQDAFAQLAAQEARAVQPPRPTPQPMLRRAQVLAGGNFGQAVDEDGVPLETTGTRTRMILPFAGIAVLAALIGWFVVRTVVSGGHSTPAGLQIALSTPSPDTLVASTPAPATAPLSATAPKDAASALPPDPPATAGKAGAPAPAGASPPGAVPRAGTETSAAVAAPPERAVAAHADPAPPAKPESTPGTTREAAAEHGRPPAPAAAAPAVAEAAVAPAHPPAAPPSVVPAPVVPAPVAPLAAVAPTPARPAPQHSAPEQQAMASPSPPPAVSPAPMAAPALPPGPGLLVIAKAEDTLQSLYSRVYKGLPAPPFEVVEAMNPHEIKLGDVVVFPSPPGGWHKLPNTAGR